MSRWQPKKDIPRSGVGHRVSTATVAWLAGLLEGEASFRCKLLRRNHRAYGMPAISLEMVDRDVVEGVARLFTCVCHSLRPRTRHQPTFRTETSGRRAAAWMMTLYPLLGSRRQAKVRELLVMWRTSGGRFRKRVLRRAA